MKQTAERSCELCSGAAAVYCEADAAFLCWACDARVHGANFLVARHLRWIACSSCHSLDAARLLSGAGGSPPFRSICRSCAPASSDLSSSTMSAGSCVSTAESAVQEEEKQEVPAASGRRRGAAAARPVDVRAEGILVNWSRKMGLIGGGKRCVEVATHVMGACMRAMTGMPLRVRLAAALWFAIKRGSGLRCSRTCDDVALRGLEACSGVPAKLIVLVESGLARAARRARV